MSDRATTKVVDLSGVTEASDINPKRQPAGDYSAKIISVSDAPAKSDGIFQWKFVIKVGSGTYPYYCKLQENQLWKLRNLCIAAGKNVPKKKIKLDPNTLVGKVIGVTLEDDEYKDKLKSTVASVFPASELDDSTVSDDDEDDYEDEEEEEEEDAPEADEEEEEDEEEPEPAPAPRRKRPAVAPAKKAPRRKAAPVVTDDELEELDIDEV